MEYYGIKKNFQFVSKYIDICKNFYIHICIYKVSNNRGKNGEKIQRDDTCAFTFSKITFSFYFAKKYYGIVAIVIAFKRNLFRYIHRIMRTITLREINS